MTSSDEKQCIVCSSLCKSAPLAGIEFQKAIEKKTFDAGGGRWEIPADMNEIFPDFITGALLNAFKSWKENYLLFVSDHAILLSAETRTSSPVRIKCTGKYKSVNIKNLYPIGEGSGHTGGIASSAADAIRAVEASV